MAFKRKTTRRAVLQDFAGLAAATGAAGFFAKPGVAEALGHALERAQEQDGDGNAAAFWSTFTDTQTHARGLFHKAPGTDSDRQVNFLHYKDSNLTYSENINPTDLPDYPGDVSANISVGGIRLSTEDRTKFNDTKSAQLRIDMMQGQKMYNLLDPLAWMALATVSPTKAGELPPLENLKFNPGTSMQNMSNIVLPGGVANLAVNVSMLHKTSPFLTVLNALAGDASQLAPILGLPAISVTALQGFSKFYGYLENRTTFLFQGRPTAAFATQSAAKEANTTIGMNLPEGDYILVPQAHTDDLKPFLSQLTLSSGYLVAKDDKSTSSVYERAQATKPDISYVTLHVAIKPIIQTGSTSSTITATPAKTTPATTTPKTTTTTPH
jgi:hypothetical protein